MTHIACIIIATERRRAQLRSAVLCSVIGQGFDDIIVVGDWATDRDDPSWEGWGVRYIRVAPLLRTTTDALVKRDIGTLATDADILVYLCDDHALGPHFGSALRDVRDDAWDVLVPNRITHNGTERIALNNGEHDGYCGGHAGVFRRDVIVTKPWTAHEHHRNWDALISHELRARGARFCWSPRADLHVVDVEPQAHPWE